MRSSPKVTTQNRRAVVWASGLAPAATGIGVFQRQVYPRLSRNPAFDVHLWSPQDRRQLELVTYSRGWTRPKDIWNFAAQLLTPTRGDVAFLTTTPTPLYVRRPAVGVVYDLRWLRTRGSV